MAIPTHICQVCGNEFQKYGTPKYCSRSCANKAPGRMTPEIRARISRVGADHPHYKGGQWTAKDGRVWLRTGFKTYRRRYHIVWDEAHPENPIQPGEIIHHMNHDPTDDRIENLMKITQSQHAHEHDFGDKGRRGWPEGNPRGRKGRAA